MIYIERGEGAPRSIDAGSVFCMPDRRMFDV